MNVLFVVDSLNEGGAGRVVARLASFFQKSGIVTSVLPIFDNAISYEIDSSVEVYTTFDKPLEHSVTDRIKLIRTCATRAKADVVISFLSYINLYAIVAGIGKKWTTVVSERNNPYKDPGNKKIRFIRKYLYLMADGFVFQTEDARDYFFKRIREAGCVIPNPVADDIPNSYVGNRTKRIVSAGRLTKQKNYTLALNAISKVLKKHPDFIYEIYGQGEERDSILQLINQLDIEDKVILKGQVSGLLEKIEDASVFLLSSDYEGISNSLIEALAIGLPVVSTDHPIGGARLLIQSGENGILVPVGDVEKTTEAICNLIESPEKAKKISMNASKVRDDYSIRVIGKKWIDYINVINGRR